MKGLIPALVAVMGFASATVAQPSMEEIVKKWDERRAKLKGVKYEFEETTTYYLDGAKPGQPKEYTLRKKRTFIVDCQTGSFRNQTDGESWSIRDAKVVPHKGATVYRDNKLFSVRWPNTGTSGVGVDVGRVSDFTEITGNLASQAFRIEIRPLLYDLGIVPLLADQELVPGTFHTYRPAEYADAVTPANDKALSPDRFWYTFGSAERVAKHYPGRIGINPRCNSLVSDYIIDRKPARSVIQTHVVHGLAKADFWGTKSWTVNATMNGMAVSKTECKVLGADYDYVPLPSDFELKPDTGMIASKTEIPNTGENKSPERTRIDFRVEPDGTHTLLGGPAEQGWFRRNWLWLFGVVALLILGAVGLRRSRRPT